MRKSIDVLLPDGTSVKVTKLPAVGRKRRRSSSKEYNGRKTVYSSHIPTVRKKYERKSNAHWDSGLDHNLASRVKRANADNPSPMPVREIDKRQLEIWSNNKVRGFQAQSYREKKHISNSENGISLTKHVWYSDNSTD